MQSPSIFTRIINGEIPSHKIYEDEHVIAILTINPFADGHTLVIPKQQVADIWDLDTKSYAYLWSVTKQIGAHLREAMGTERVGIVVKGFEVPHVHIHLIPINKGDSLDRDDESVETADDDDLALIADTLRLT